MDDRAHGGDIDPLVECPRTVERPAWLARVGEPVGSVLENLDRAARLGLMSQRSGHWLAARALRNRMVHESIHRPEPLAEAVNAAHLALPILLGFVAACRAYFDKRHQVCQPGL